jgi:hypothetical protein
MFSVLALSLVLCIVATIIRVSVVRVSFAEANVYRNSSTYLLRKTLYEVGSRRTAVFVEIKGGNSHYIYYFRLIFPLAFIYLRAFVCVFLYLAYLVFIFYISFLYFFDVFFQPSLLSWFSFIFVFNILIYSFFLVRSSFSFIIISSLFFPLTVFIPSYRLESNHYSRGAAPKVTPSVMQRIVPEAVCEKTGIKECFLLSLLLFGSVPN